MSTAPNTLPPVWGSRCAAGSMQSRPRVQGDRVSLNRQTGGLPHVCAAPPVQRRASLSFCDLLVLWWPKRHPFVHAFRAVLGFVKMIYTAWIRQRRNRWYFSSDAPPGLVGIVVAVRWLRSACHRLISGVPPGHPSDRGRTPSDGRRKNIFGFHTRGGCLRTATIRLPTG